MTSDETTRSTTVGLIERIDARYETGESLQILLDDCRDELAKQAEERQLFFRIADYAGFDIETRDLKELPEAVAALNVRNAKQAERVKALENVLKLRINGDQFCFWCGRKDIHCRTCELAAVLRDSTGETK